MDSYWLLIDCSYQQILERLKATSKENLIALVVNEHYNSFLAKYANYKDDELPVDPVIVNGKFIGKRIPYHGWYWRPMDFYNKEMQIGIGKLFQGFMRDNKWDYQAGDLSEQQFNEVIGIIDRAMKLSTSGGELSEIRKRTCATLEELWPLLQSFQIETNND